jgi:hypothetical protein
VLDGKVSGGQCFGYGNNGPDGQHVIYEPEAKIVRRIFSEYAAGRSPREIVKQLNRERMPGPGRWELGTDGDSRPRQARHRLVEQPVLCRHRGLGTMYRWLRGLAAAYTDCFVRRGPHDRDSATTSINVARTEFSAGTAGHLTRCGFCGR